MNIILRTYHGIEWHSGEDTPELGKPLYALIEEDVHPNMTPEPQLVSATVSYQEGGNPEYLWNIEGDDGVESYLIAGGWSVILWRYQ
jgi:hypothetical protein